MQQERVAVNSKLTGILAGLILTFFTVNSGAVWLDSEGSPVTANIIVIGLNEPQGLLYDDALETLFVAEQGANRIVAVKDRVVVPIASQTLMMNKAYYVMYGDGSKKPGPRTHLYLNKPSGIVFDSQGMMYVSEYNPEGGRLIQFSNIEENQMVAHEIKSPYMRSSHGYTGMSIDPRDRLYVSAVAMQTNSLFSFGSVIMKDNSDTWWMIDSGPFAEFSNVAVAPDGHTIAVAEMRNGDLSWYDTHSRQLVANIDVIEGIRHIALLSDGTTIATIERANGNWGVVEVDPLARRMKDWAGDLPRIGGLAVHPTKREVFISLVDDGKVMRLMRYGEKKAISRNKLMELSHTYRLKEALPPHEWPEFFKKFIEKLDVVRTVNKYGMRTADADDARPTLTINEFSEALPVVAGKMKATLIGMPDQEPDPIEEVAFALFYPNQNTVAEQEPAPGISLFSVKHRSGKIKASNPMPGPSGKLHEGMKLEDMPDMIVYLPNGHYSTKSTQTGHGQLRVFYLGMGLGPDYWLDIDRYKPEESFMIVERRDGSKVKYALTPYEERLEAGRHSILVAGVTPHQTEWFELGKGAIRWNLIKEEMKAPRFRHTMTMDDLKKSGLQLSGQRSRAQAEIVDESISELQRRIILRSATRWKTANFLVD